MNITKARENHGNIDKRLKIIQKSIQPFKKTVETPVKDQRQTSTVMEKLMNETFKMAEQHETINQNRQQMRGASVQAKKNKKTLRPADVHHTDTVKQDPQSQGG